MDRIRLLGSLLATALLVFGLGGTVGATPTDAGGTYSATLSGGEEVPSRTTPASGLATFQVSADGLALTYSVTVSNISNVISGHIHLGPKGANGDIVLPLVPVAQPGSGPRSGVIGQGTARADQLTGPLQGKTLLDLVAQMDAGNAYVNIHTASGASPAAQVAGDLPPGEIRGQIMAATPAKPAAMPGAGGGFGARGVTSPLLLVVGFVLALGAGVVGARRRQAG